MQTRKDSSNLYKLLTTVGMIVFAIIAFLKFIRVYDTMNFGEYSAVLAVSTLAILFGVFFTIKYFSNKCAYIFMFIMYSFVSVVMFIDSVYFSFNNKLTSVANIKLIWQLEAVENSINAINPTKFLWILLDIPIILIYIGLIHKMLCNIIQKKLNKDIRIKAVKIFLTVLISAVIISTTYFAYTVNFKIRYLKAENIIYHTLDIWNCLFDTSSDINYDKYLAEKTINKDEKYGIAKGKNVVIIQIEALQSFVLDQEYEGQEIMPFLDSLKKDSSFYFDNYFYQVGAGNTADAEFTVNNSILASSENAAYVEYYQNDYYGLPYILKDNGYKVANVFHAYKPEFWNRESAYIKQGFDNFYSMNDYSSDDIIGMGLSDEKFLSETVKKIKNMQKPFYSFIITLSSHHPFYMSKSNINIKSGDEETLFGMYINSARYVDNCLKQFFKDMKKNGLYNDTIFVIYGDHFGIPNYNYESVELASEMLGRDYSVVDMFGVPLIIHIPGMKNSEVIETVAGHVDVLPTLLHLLGIENNKSIMMGNDIFSVKDNIVYEQMHIGKGSYITNDIFYYCSSSGIDIFNKAYDLKTGKMINITSDMTKQSKYAEKVIQDANIILKKNLILKNNKLKK